ncbi:MAG TPA: hypothetical protein VM183_02850 [Burkholderiales bacterium]|nr:hypothetical protein [Burkholderiales bacterium]
MSPFTWWTDVAFKLWGLGKPILPDAPETPPVSVAVIPTGDAPKAAQAVSKPKRTKVRAKPKVKAKSRSKSRR